jgi:hypothetical protein
MCRALLTRRLRGVHSQNGLRWWPHLRCSSGHAGNRHDACSRGAESGGLGGQEITPSDTRMRFRKERIAWSVVWGILALLLIALWVRSYWWIDIATGAVSTTKRVGISSGSGWLTLTWNHPLDGFTHWTMQHNSVAYIEDFTKNALARGEQVPTRAHNFGLSTDRFQLPHWSVVCLVLLGATIALPWIRWRFSLRTLLIATTLIAVGLGLIVWLTG